MKPFFAKYIPIEGGIKDVKDGDVYISKHRQSKNSCPYVQFHANNSTIPKETPHYFKNPLYGFRIKTLKIK